MTWPKAVLRAAGRLLCDSPKIAHAFCFQAHQGAAIAAGWCWHLSSSVCWYGTFAHRGHLTTGRILWGVSTWFWCTTLAKVLQKLYCLWPLPSLRKAAIWYIAYINNMHAFVASAALTRSWTGNKISWKPRAYCAILTTCCNIWKFALRWYGWNDYRPLCKCWNTLRLAFNVNSIVRQVMPCLLVVVVYHGWVLMFLGNLR